MKILVVSQCFYPDVYALNDIVRQMVSDGHAVTVLTGLPDYTTSKVPKEYKWFRNRHQDFHGADVHRVSIIARHHGPIFRALNYLSFAFTGWLYATFHKFDEFDAIYVWEVSPVTMAVPAIRLKHRYKKPLFLYCMDLWPESVKAMGFKEGTFLYRVFHWISRKIYSHCDHIAVSSKPFFDYLEGVNGYSKSKMTYLPQFASDSMLDMDLTKNRDSNVDFLFIGNIGKVQDVDVIIKACNEIKSIDNWKMHIVGNGSNIDICRNLVKEFQLEDKVIFHGSCTIAESVKYYKSADACILTLNGDNMIGSTLPGKLQTYMAAGKPILGAINGAGNEVIKESGCGATVSAGDYKGLASLMKSYIDNPEQYAECGMNARNYFSNNFTVDKHFTELYRQLNGMIEERK